MYWLECVLFLVIWVLVFKSGLQAKIVEVWPAYNYTKKFKNNKNVALYTKNFNFIVKDGYVYPVDSLLTRNYYKYRPYFASAISLDSTSFMKALKDINETRSNWQNIVDPINILKSFLPGKKNSYITNSYIDDAVNNFFMGVANVIVNRIKEGKFTKSQLTKAVIEYVFKDEYLKSLHSNLFTFLLKNDGIKYIISKTIGIGVDYIWEAGVNEGSIKILGNKLYSGFMGGLTFYMEIINGSVNILSTIWAIDKIEDLTYKKLIDIYVNDFLRDYAAKYNTNIIKMARDSEVKFYGKTYVPNNFYQLFVLYTAKQKHLTYDDLMKLNGRFMYYMWLGAHNALKLIEQFGDGGNLKIYLDVNDETNTIKIHPKSYFLKSFYWMLPISLKNDVKFVMEDKITLDGILNIAYTNFKIYNPFGEISNILYSNNHVNIIGFANLKNVNIENKFENKAFELNLTKVINYNGFIKYKRGQIYKKIQINYSHIFIPKFNINKSNKLLYKYLTMGIISPSLNIGENEFNPIIDATDIKLYFYRFGKIFKFKIGYSGYDLNNAFKTINWSSPIKRKQFFKFLVKLFKLDTNKNYSYYLNVYNNIFSQKICKNTIPEGCILKIKGLSNGKYPNSPLTLFQVLLTLDKIENHYRSQK
jgi:hypothetical protein